MLGCGWFGSHRFAGRKGVVGFLILNALLPEVKVCTNATPLEYPWHYVAGHREERSLSVECVYMPSVAVAEEKRYQAMLTKDIFAPQELGQVLILTDLNARIGSAAVNLDVFCRCEETHTSAGGQRLIQPLHGTSTYAFNGRVPCAKPTWARCRMSMSEESVHDT